MGPRKLRLTFNAIRDGDIERVKFYMGLYSADEREKIINTEVYDTTLLVMACRYGHSEIAEFLIEECHANIEQAGSVSFDGETIEGATPLWCAAAAGHLSVVKKLIKYNAMVNSTTKTNSTPLRAACFDGHFEIVKYLILHGADTEIANHHGHTCLMIASYKKHLKIVEYLLLCGANVNRKSVKGNTALHDCSESGNLQILQLLLRNSAKMDVDSNGMTPLLSAAAAGHSHIVEYIISETLCTEEEKVDALELLGTTYIDKKRDMLSALDYWTRAMKMRFQNPADPIEKPLHKSPISAYINTTEVSSFSGLEELVSDPDAMRMQALLIRERILGPGHPDTAYYIRYRGAAYADAGHFDRCILLWMYALDVQQSVLEPLSPVTQSSFLSFVELFSYMITGVWGSPESVPVVGFDDILNIFNRAIKEIKTAMKYFPLSKLDNTVTASTFQKSIVIALHFIGLMCKLQPYLAESDDLRLKRVVYDLVRMNLKCQKDQTLLHVACSKQTWEIGRYPVCTFPSIDIASVLLEVGACPNALDNDKNTPLHSVISNDSQSKELFKILLNHGAHIDMRNLKGKTPLQLAKVASICDICPLKYINLQCLCAQVIQDFNIPFHDVVPKKLETFLETH